MVTPIRIGGLTLNLSNLCYAVEATDGSLLLQFAGHDLTLTGEQARAVRRYLHGHSADISPLKLPREAWLQSSKVGA